MADQTGAVEKKSPSDESSDVSDIMDELKKIQNEMKTADQDGNVLGPEGDLEPEMGAQSEPEKETAKAPEAVAESTPQAADAAPNEVVDAPVVEPEEPEKPEKDEDPMKEFREGASSESMEDTLGLGAEDVQGGLLSSEPAGEGGAQPLKKPSMELVEEESTMAKKESPKGGDEGRLSIQLTGNMKLHLKYDCNGHEVTVGFEEECLLIQTNDGGEFKIPVRGRAPLKAVA